jgi:hypothetical protein
MLKNPSTPATGAASAGTPPVPPSPLLPAPAPMIAPRPQTQPRSVSPVFSGPTPSQKAARNAAVAARNAANSLLTQLNGGLANLRTQLQVHEANADGAAEWTRENVDAAAIKKLADDVEALLDKYMPKAATPA